MKFFRENLPIQFDRRSLTGAITLFQNLLYGRILNAQSPSGPAFVTWMPTMDCNAYCSFCSTHKLKREYPEKIELDRCLSLADEIAAAGTWVVGFTGGEVLLYPHLFILISRLRKQGVLVYVVTNGLLLENMADQLIKADVNFIVVSLDSDRAEEHDAIRGCPGLFHAAMRGIQKLKTLRHRGYPLIKSTTVITKTSLERLGKILDYLKQHVDIASAQPITYGYTQGPHGKKKENMQSFIFKQDDEPFVQECFRKLAETHPIFRKKYFAEIPQYWFSPGKLIEQTPCWAPFLRLVIMPTGAALHCAVNPSYANLGNFNRQSLMEIWNSPIMQQHREEIRTQCNHCICWDQSTSFNAFLASIPLVNRLPALRRRRL